MNIIPYTTYDLPVPYKELKLYPATMRDYISFNAFAQCLTLDKNSIPDPEIISMTNLEYIYSCTGENPSEQPYLIWLDRLLSICLKEDKSFEKIEESILRYKYDTKYNRNDPIFIINDKPYGSEDFEEIKNIIAEQNMVELIDENISKEVRDSLEKARAFKRKISENKPASIEDYMIALSVATGWTLDFIYSMSIRKFTKSIRRMNNLLHYKIYLAASMSGMVEFKDKSFIIHWLSSLDDEDKYGDVSVSLEEMENKISFESAKTGA